VYIVGNALGRIIFSGVLSLVNVRSKIFIASEPARKKLNQRKEGGRRFF